MILKIITILLFIMAIFAGGKNNTMFAYYCMIMANLTLIISNLEEIKKKGE